MCLRVYTDLQGVLRLIKSNEALIKKIPIGESFVNQSVFIERVKVNDPFNDIQDIYSYINYANVFELYANDVEILRDLESSYKVAQSQEGILLDLQKEIDSLVSKVDKMNEQLESKQNEKSKLLKR